MKERYAAWLPAALATLALACGGDGDGTKPNVFLISIESLRADHVGCYGYERRTTPNIDRLASEATLYRNARSVTSWTLTSHATLLTGLYPSAHRVIEPRHRLADSYETLAETFSGAGYQCAGYASGPFLRTPYNLHQGFEIYDDSPSAVTQESAHGDITNPAMEQLLGRFFESDRDTTRPFFLFAYLWDVHYDFLPPPPYDTLFLTEGAERFDISRFEANREIRADMGRARTDYLISQYDGEIRCTDDLLGRVWDRMKKLGLWENTIVVVTSDHGEEFFEHGSKGHKNNLFIESIHVPLIVKWSPSDGAAIDERLTGLIDLYPTLLEAASIDPPESHGRSLLAEPRGDDTPFFQELVTTRYGRGLSGQMRKSSERWWAVRMGRYKLFSVPERPINLLYDVAADPGETRPIEAERPELTERYLKLLGPWQSQMRPTSARHDEGGEAKLSTEELERLRALGYIESTGESPASEGKDMEIVE